MTTKITVDPTHTVRVEVRGEAQTILDILEAGSAPRDYHIWGATVLTVLEPPEDRALIDDEKPLRDEISSKAGELQTLLKRVSPGRSRSLAMLALEESVMWTMK